MPLDAVAAPPAPGHARSPLPAASLDRAEREAAAHFAQQLRADLARRPPEANRSMLLLISLAPDLEDASVRLVPSGEARAVMTSDEMALVWVLQGVPRSGAGRRALVARLTAAAAVTWRQHCQIQRLGFLLA